MSNHRRFLLPRDNEIGGQISFAKSLVNISLAIIIPLSFFFTSPSFFSIKNIFLKGKGQGINIFVQSTSGDVFISIELFFIFLSLRLSLFGVLLRFLNCDFRMWAARMC